MTNPIYISGQLAYVMSNGIMPAFTQAAQITGVDRNLLLAVASRESNMGLALDENWLGDNGYGIGIMQIDRRYHPEFAARYEANNHYANIQKGAQFLGKNLKRFGGNIKAAVAAYNAGGGDVSRALARGINPDLMTTGQDYAADVLSRYRTINAMGGADKDPVAELKAFFGLTILGGVAGLAYQLTSNSKLNHL